MFKLFHQIAFGLKPIQESLYDYCCKLFLNKICRHIVFLSFVLPIFTLAQKPILPDFYADPAVHVFNNKIFIYPTHDVTGTNGFNNPTDWHCFTSKNLEDWKDDGVIFSLKDITWADKKAYAADCIKYKGKYYFYFTANYQIGVAVSKYPDKGFKDALGKPMIQSNAGGTKVMDPSIFIDDDGQRYLYFGQNKLCVVKLKKNMIEMDGEIKTLEVTNFHEGIWVHKKDGLYYFSYPSEKGDKIANLLEYSTSKSPEGPFEYKGILMDNRSRNIHHSIVKVLDKWYIFYHVQSASPYERRVCADYIDYNEDGTIKPIIMTKTGIKKINI